MATYQPEDKISFGLGSSLTYNFTPFIGATVYADYHQINSKINYKYSDVFKQLTTDRTLLANGADKQNIAYVTVGAKLTAFF